MTCAQCGQEVSGRFCGGCGAATNQASSTDAVEEAALPEDETFTPTSLGLVHTGYTESPMGGTVRTTPRPSGVETVAGPPEQSDATPDPKETVPSSERAKIAPMKTAVQRLVADLSRRNRYLLGGGVTLAVLAIAALIINVGGGPKTIFDAAVGECLNDQLSSGKSISSVVLDVPCQDRHSLEIYFTTTYDAQAIGFPGTATLNDFAQTACHSHFSDYVGISPEKSDFDFLLIPPEPQEWCDGVRTVVCAVIPRDSQYSYGSQRGAGN